MTELSGIELRKAVATALGWSETSGGSWWHECTPETAHIYYRLTRPVDERARHDYAGTGNFYTLYLPRFDESLDACFAPGGPVERLRADHGLDLGMTEADTWLAVFYPMSGDEGGGSAESSNPAEAVCRAFLAAVSKPVERALVENLEGQE